MHVSHTEVDKPDPPEFLTRPKLLTIEEGSRASFTCCVKGHPSPVVRWERDGCTLSTDKKYKISSDGNSSTLEILAPDKSDAGQYTCHVENCAGSASHICSLVISHTRPAKSAPVDFRSLLKPHQQIGKQGSTDSERSDKENEVRDFRNLLRNNRQATPPPSTAARDSKTSGSANSTHRPVSAASDRATGLRKTLALFEKKSSTEEPTKTATQFSPARSVDRVKSAPVRDRVFNKSSSQQFQAASSVFQTLDNKEPSKISGPSSTEPVKNDFRSVLSNRQRNFERNGNTSDQQRDLKFWSKDSYEPNKNVHSREVKSLPPGKIDFRNVLKNRHTEKEEKPPPPKDLKTSAHSKDHGSLVVRGKNGTEEKQNGHSRTADTHLYLEKTTRSPAPKDVNSLKSKFESQPQDFRSVQLKAVRPQQAVEKPAPVEEKPKRPTDLRVQILNSRQTDPLPRRKEPESLPCELDTTKTSALSPSSDSSLLSDSSKLSEISKTTDTSGKSDDSREYDVPDLSDFRSRRRADRWRESGESGGRRPSDVSQSPNIQNRLSDQRVHYGGKAVLQCKVEGVPEPNIKWSFNKKIIKPSKFFQLSFADKIAQLVVAEAFSEDEGEYTCTAINTAGTDSCSCYLSVDASSSQSSRSEGQAFEGPVHTPPRVLALTPRDLTVQRGQPVNINATFSGEPAPSVRWFQAKTELSPGNHCNIMSENGKSSLVIDAVSPNHAGRYTVTITNDLGSDLMSATINVEDVPEPPMGKPHVYDISKRSVSLSWCGPPFDGGCQVTHYAIEVRDSHSQTWTTLIPDCKSTSYHALNLIPERSYQFRVRAGNKLGLSDPSDTSEVVVMTDPLQTSEDYESDDELPFEPRQVSITADRKFEDHYELLQEVGRGKFGNVYKCREKASGKHWAAKVVKCREREKEGLRLEVKVMNELAHPKLLMLWDAFEEPRKMVLVMEYVGAGELFERVIREDFVLTERDCVHFLRQICSGVGYMHSQSVLHLDLKPENVLCVSDNSNQIKIIDFGLARFYKPGESIRVLFGTPEFIAPEVINYDEIGYATDLWSIGVICYILLSGLSPFLGDNDAETLANVTSGEYDFDDDSFEEISENAKDFIRRLLVKRKEKRNTISQCLQHPWLAQEDMRIRNKRLNTERLKCFMARRKWQKTGNAIRALGRMASLQKLLQGGSSSSASSTSSTPLHTPTPTSAGPGALLAPIFDPPVPTKDASQPLSSPAKDVRHLEDKPADPDTAEADITDGTAQAKGDNTLPTSGVKDKPAAVVKTSEAAKDLDPSPVTGRKLFPKNAAVQGVSEETGATHPPKTTDSPETTRRTNPAAAAESFQRHQPDHHLPRSQKTNGLSPSHDSHLANGGCEENHSPQFMKEMVDCTAFHGDVVRFDVTVTGNPAPELIWLFEDEELEEDERHILELGGNGQCSLIVRNVIEDDEGEYSCKAKNHHGEVTCSAELIIYGTGSF